LYFESVSPHVPSAPRQKGSKCQEILEYVTNDPNTTVMLDIGLEVLNLSEERYCGHISIGLEAMKHRFCIGFLKVTWQINSITLKPDPEQGQTQYKHRIHFSQHQIYHIKKREALIRILN
ncbi:hypothetical protein ACJX0J_009161, partial [Zea mays]